MSRMISRAWKGTLAAGAAAIALQACVPAEGGGGVASGGAPAVPGTISQADKQQGAKAHPELLAEFGGARLEQNFRLKNKPIADDGDVGALAKHLT